MASDIVAPLLIVFGRQDRLIPWQHAVRLRDAVAGPVELLMLEDGNHGCANVAARHRPPPPTGWPPGSPATPTAVRHPPPAARPDQKAG